jgi:Fur family transcriptional regulator, ferric uptake regulator
MVMENGDQQGFKQRDKDKIELKNAGLKITAPRLKILQLLESADQRHFTAEELYQEFVQSGEEIGLATVYRVLTQFEAAGLVIRHHFEGNQSVFELAKGDHHDHLICVRCGRVEEFMDDVIEARQQVISQLAHFKMSHHFLNIYGCCQTCETKKG